MRSNKKNAYLAADRVVMLAIMFQILYNICRAYLKENECRRCIIFQLQ